MGRVGEHSLTRRRRRAGALATASPTTRRRPTHYAHYLSARGGGRHSPTSPLAGGPLTTRTKLVRVVAEPASVRRRRALRAARRTTPLAAGRRHSLPRTKLVRVVSRPPTTTPGSTSPLDPPRRTTSPRPAHRLTCADLVPRRARDHSLTTSSVLFTRPGEGSCRTGKKRILRVLHRTTW